MINTMNRSAEGFIKMLSSQPALPLASYAFRYLAEHEMHVPNFPGALWHSVFGARLRERSCLMPDSECESCPLRHRCNYTLIFRGQRPPDAPLMPGISTIPVPHIFQFDSNPKALICAGDTLRVSIVLVGIANNRISSVIQAMAAAGESGLGSHRSRLRLVDVVQRRADGLLQPIGINGRSGDPHAPMRPETPPVPQTVRVRFRSPYNADGKRSKPNRIDVARFLGKIVRRCSLLQGFYTDRELEAPFADLKAASAAARPISAELRVQSDSRYSAHRGDRKPTGGLLGHFDLDLTGLEPLWPYLHLGQWLNVGKNASMGYGQYELTALD